MQFRSFLTLALAVFLTVSVADNAQAKRFGSGGFGKSFSSSPFKKAPATSPSKANKPADKQQAAPAGGQGRKGMMGGLMGGLLAGGLFAYLLGNGAFEGLQFMDILLFGLIGFVLFKLFAGQRRQAAGPAGQYFQGREQAPLAGTGQSSVSDIPMDLPNGMDVSGFTSRALEHFKLVHEAWDKGNMDLVAEYLAPELLQELTEQRRSQNASMKHEVLDLTAEIVRSEPSREGHILSVLFRGRMIDVLENEEMGVFDVWHLQQRDNGPWLIIGIEAQ